MMLTEARWKEAEGTCADRRYNDQVDLEVQFPTPPGAMDRYGS
jgi:hypothetical protein